MLQWFRIYIWFSKHVSCTFHKSVVYLFSIETIFWHDLSWVSGSPFTCKESICECHLLIHEDYESGNSAGKNIWFNQNLLQYILPTKSIPLEHLMDDLTLLSSWRLAHTDAHWFSLRISLSSLRNHTFIILYKQLTRLALTAPKIWWKTLLTELPTQLSVMSFSFDT